ncbi:lysozyme C, milk isozyme-like isoform X2 [Tachyglossus aculeatus]|uniref:lysozyme C, milk isozyme-like isoform X2 n=1 Tax=Tachyglossus aculeatus TaxID=9261 RepID=UPI0018F4A4D4|nr:lysozyme C, milk isozyme-like isoform X2 [Tachyglossus aculeatus]
MLGQGCRWATASCSQCVSWKGSRGESRALQDWARLLWPRTAAHNLSVWKPVREMRGLPSSHHLPRWGPLLCLLATFILDTEALVLSQCELAHALQEGGLDGYHDHSLAHWLCLAHHGSGLNTEAVFRLPDGSLGYGIFQIRGHKWCSPGEGLSENRCRMDCQDLLDTDLSNDIACAKIMMDNPSDTDAWDPWSHHCEGHDLADWDVECDH